MHSVHVYNRRLTIGITSLKIRPRWHLSLSLSVCVGGWEGGRRQKRISVVVYYYVPTINKGSNWSCYCALLLLLLLLLSLGDGKVNTCLFFTKTICVVLGKECTHFLKKKKWEALGPLSLSIQRYQHLSSCCCVIDFSFLLENQAPGG